MVYSGIYHSIFCVHSIFYARIIILTKVNLMIAL